MFSTRPTPKPRGLSGLYRGITGTVQICRPEDTTFPYDVAAPKSPVLSIRALPGSGAKALHLVGADGAYTAQIVGGPTTGSSYGLRIIAGANSVDLPFVVSNRANALTFAQIFGDGHGTLGPSTTLGLSWNTAGNVVVAAPTSGAGLSLPAGTTTVYPLLINSGVALTSPVLGAVEFDGTALYFTPAASSRAVSIIEYIEVMSGTKTLVSQTAAQAILNGTTNGAVTLPVGTYEFECLFSLTALSATAGSSFGFALGGTATFTQAWWAIADKVALATASAPQMTFDTAANTSLATGTANTTGYAQITGIIRVTVAGTVIPQVSQTTAAAAVVGANSFARFRVVGGSAVQSVGNWS